MAKNNEKKSSGRGFWTAGMMAFWVLMLCGCGGTAVPESKPAAGNEGTSLYGSESESMSLPESESESTSLPESESESMSLPESESESMSLPGSESESMSLPGSENVDGSDSEGTEGEADGPENLTAPKLLAITVDDGPDGSGCEAYLQICRENEICVTFFVIGQNIEKNQGQLQDMLDAGCEIGNHSWSHPYLTGLSAAEIQKELSDTDEKIRDAVSDAEISFVRAPYFAYSETVCAKAGRPLIDAALSESDSDKTEETLQTLLGAEDGDIVLLHCWNQGSIQALREAVPRLKAQGFRFVTVSELFEEKGVEPVAGKVYRHVALNLQRFYRQTERIFSDGQMTDGDWNHWTDAASLPLSKIKEMAPGQALWVEYESVAAPCLILQSWSGGAGWVQMTPTSDDGRTAIFTYEDMLAQFGAADFGKLNACSLRPMGADLQVDSVELSCLDE